MRRQYWELLEKYAKMHNDRESGKFAQEMLVMKRGVCVQEEDDEETDKRDDGIFLHWVQILPSSLPNPF